MRKREREIGVVRGEWGIWYIISATRETYLHTYSIPALSASVDDFV